ncbi:MAG: PAAR domain-containing protein [Pseudomonas sp.]|uniref:PAAR domain-containing protein n=1 Tax=Pseudomonas sp. TaxID=306 RepID=UPI003D11BBF5
MTGKPAARVTDPTTCPLPGHGITPISSGSPNVLLDNLPAARQGDRVACGSLLTGNLVSNVLINGKPVATVGSTGSHGDHVAGGSATVLIGTNVVIADIPVVPPIPGRFNEQFELLDAEGEPVAGFNYKITTASGRVFRGTTDSAGLSRRIHTEKAEMLHIEPDDRD